MGIRDSKLVKSAWKNKNYIIQTDDSVNTKKCAIYFSSNAIYYPDTEDAFFERIIKRDSYEWYGKRVSDASKHIFVRDVFFDGSIAKDFFFVINKISLFFVSRA